MRRKGTDIPYISLILGTMTTFFVMLFFALIRAHQLLAFQTNMFLRVMPHA
jgi:hypothetical protein